MTSDGFTLKRTGNIFSFASTEFLVTYPDGHVGTIWSPPWHELDDAEEDAAALAAAKEMFQQGKHKTPKASVRVEQ